MIVGGWEYVFAAYAVVWVGVTLYGARLWWQASHGGAE